ncbi:hypothetical protein BKA81DRAFT_50116 [Phyllosticta paracitricarpa]
MVIDEKRTMRRSHALHSIDRSRVHGRRLRCAKARVPGMRWQNFFEQVARRAGRIFLLFLFRLAKIVFGVVWCGVVFIPGNALAAKGLGTRRLPVDSDSVDPIRMTLEVHNKRRNNSRTEPKAPSFVPSSHCPSPNLPLPSSTISPPISRRTAPPAVVEPRCWPFLLQHQRIRVPTALQNSPLLDPAVLRHHHLPS